MNYTKLSLRNAIKKKLLESITTDFESFEKDELKMEVRVYEGDTTLDEVNLTSLFQEANTVGVIVNGNLTVNGPVMDFELDTMSCFLLVNGSLTCTVLAAGCAEIVITGSVSVAQAMVGYYNHGIITVGGDLNGPVLVIDEHGATIQGTIHAATYCRGWQLEAADFTEWRQILLPEVADALLDEKDYLSAGDVRFLELLKHGKPVFKTDLSITAANNPEGQEVGWKKIKPLVNGLDYESEKYPFAILEKESPGLPDAKFLLYNGTTVLDSLDLNREDYLAIVVAGDLHVTGNILNQDTDSGCSLIVLGNLRVGGNVYAGGQLIYITGYTAVRGLLLGVYNHGEFVGRSFVFCPVIVSDNFKFSFTEKASVRILDLWNDDDKDTIREKLVDGLIDEDEGFVYFSSFTEGIPLLNPTVQRASITVADVLALVDTTLLQPKSVGIRFDEGDYEISIHRGSTIDDDPYGDPASIMLNTNAGVRYQWSVVGENKVAVMLQRGDESWVTAPAIDMRSVTMFTEVESIINRRVRWNDRYVKEIDADKLWDLIWLFRNSNVHEEDDFSVIANKIYNQVLCAARTPFIYIGWYPTSALRRDLLNNPALLLAASFIDGLIEYRLVQEIKRSLPLAEYKEELFIVSQYNFEYDFDVDARYDTQPIDRAFMCETNEYLATIDSALLKLDIGAWSYIVAGSHINDVETIQSMAQLLGVYSKYITAVKPEAEAALKATAGTILDAASANATKVLKSNRKHQEALWAHVYNERGDVAFWQDWMERLQRYLIDHAGVAYIDRGQPDADPIPAELDYWITWCERYEVIRKQCAVEVPE